MAFTVARGEPIVSLDPRHSIPGKQPVKTANPPQKRRGVRCERSVLVESPVRTARPHTDQSFTPSGWRLGTRPRGISRISSSRNRKFGGGTTHMVRYVSRKASQEFHQYYQYLADTRPCWIRTWPLSERHKARSNIEFQLVPWLPYQPRSTSCASENPFCRSCWWPKVWPGFEADLRRRVLSATADRALTCLDHQAVPFELRR